MMREQLFAEALGKFALGLLMVGALLFLPAGSFDYWQGWLLMAIFFAPMFVAGLIMFARAPGLLRSRLDVRETEDIQLKVVAAGALMFATGFIIAGLGHRLGWPALPWQASIVGAVVFLAAYGLYGEVLRENAYLSRTIGVQDNQTVVDTGLYGVVRHPMYAVTLPLFLSIPFVLGSPFAIAVFLAYIPLMVARIRNEEHVLERDLSGYTAYEARVRWRLVPGIW